MGICKFTPHNLVRLIFILDISFGLHRLRRYRKSGISLVEMVVTLLIFSIMMTMMVGVLSPAAKIFIRIQKLQYAQIILDNPKVYCAKQLTSPIYPCIGAALCGNQHHIALLIDKL